MSDKTRLRAHMDAGGEVCPTDWNGFHAIDGGKPILRVAARIKDLKDDGYPVERVGTRSKCAVYAKTGVSGAASTPHPIPGAIPKPEAAPETSALLNPTAGSPFDAWEAA